MTNSLKNKTKKFESVPKEMLEYLDEIIHENNCRIELKEWVNRYSPYLVYYHEPFCSEGFSLNITISSYEDANVEFVNYLYFERLNNIAHLNNCIVDAGYKNIKNDDSLNENRDNLDAMMYAGEFIHPIIKPKLNWRIW